MAVDKSKKVVVGGTFDVLHEGHKKLLRIAFGLGSVFIGLTSDKMAESFKKRKVHSFKLRKKALESFIKKEFSTKPRSENLTVRQRRTKNKNVKFLLRGKPKITKIEDKFGFTLNKDFDFIVVSPETFKTALLINRERKKLGKKPIKIKKIGFILAEDGKPISASRIIKREINKKGKVLKKNA